MAGTSGYVRPLHFSKRLSQSDIDEGRVYIDESTATTLFGCPSDARRDTKVVLSSNSFVGFKEISIYKDGNSNRYYFKIQRWMKNLRGGSTVTMSEIRASSGSTNQKKEFKFEVTNN